jgi:hypothetical protein
MALASMIAKGITKGSKKSVSERIKDIEFTLEARRKGNLQIPDEDVKKLSQELLDLQAEKEITKPAKKGMAKGGAVMKKKKMMGGGMPMKEEMMPMAKGGMGKEKTMKMSKGGYANCGASMKPAQKAKK